MMPPEPSGSHEPLHPFSSLQNNSAEETYEPRASLVTVPTDGCEKMATPPLPDPDDQKGKGPEHCPDDPDVAEADLTEHSESPESQNRNPGLCNYCRNICDNWPTEKDYERVKFEHYSTEEELFASKASCSMCNQFATAVVHIHECEPGESFHVEYDTTKPRTGYSLNTLAPGIVSCRGRSPVRTGSVGGMTLATPIWSVKIDGSTGPGDIRAIEERGLEVVSYDENTYTYASLALAPEPEFKEGVSQSTLDGLSMARFWLEKCCDNHSSCQVQTVSPTMPTRLVDFTSAHPKLRTSLKGEPAFDYATLSHCWGTTEFIVLESASLSEFHEEIPSGAISTTFKQAMSIAKTLGFDFIWIDSLCIVQDSPDDWNHESALMSRVYGNSALNISAAGASDGSVGCFFSREDFRLCKFMCGLDQSSKRKETQFLCAPDRFDSHFLDPMPLLHRGWVLQERLLATRTLHFTKTQLFWECNVLQACELLPQGFESFMGVRLSLYRGTDLTQACVAWTNIVQVYSNCCLTKSQDKLVAISGIAQSFQKGILGRYLAGLWSNCMEPQLCWHVYTKAGSSLRERPADYRAPSWSWASTNGNVTCYYGRNDVFLVHVEDVVVRSVTEGVVFGQVLGGILSVSCKFLLSTRIGMTESGHLETGYFFQVDDEKIDLYIYADSSEDQIFKGDPLKDVCLLPVLSQTQGLYRGLVLIPTGEPGQYRRIGLFRVPNEHSGFNAALNSESCKAPDEAYARIKIDENGKELRIIDII